ncbi:Six-hairpin glycosidase-like protein [Biscogniauxia marginata]|nr:Six-hairpin glycosidase-like protein [Biscogniauxia marginata]
MIRFAIVLKLSLFLGLVNCGVIDRSAGSAFPGFIVSKYNVIRTNLIDNDTTPLQVGNGNFAYNVDNTGMQTFLPFNTLSSWAWHNDSLPANGEEISDYHGVTMVTHGRNVTYDIPNPELPEASQWLISNPNRINLGRIGLKYRGTTLSADKILEPIQKLDLWNGTIISTFNIDGETVEVITQGDFETDAVSIQIESKLISSGALEVELDFPYPPIHSTKYKYEVFVGVYDFPLNHSTSIREGSIRDTTHIYHKLQNTSYFLNLRWPSNSPLALSKNDPEGSTAITAHRYTLSPSSKVGPSSSVLAFTAHFSPKKREAPLPSTIQKRNTVSWNQYWSQGGFVDITSSSNPKADELQRRIILSQYHVRVNSAADGQSPQESGLMNNGWYGKFHMEMVVWHNAHWITWGRQKHFDDIFPKLYETLLPSSLARARSMGWGGARWPKMTEIGTGVSSPGGINGLLLWQQPHPMYLAELAYTAKPTRQTLERWDRVLTATADYLASYAWKNETSGKYDLGPPAYGVTENTPPSESLNLAYEIAYWRYALDIARTWKTRLDRPVPPQWTTVSSLLAPPPRTEDGLYAVYAGLNSTWWADAELAADPRSLVMLRGLLPDTPAVDAGAARRTADRVAAAWADGAIRGWGRPVLAINSARIGDPARAVRHLTAFDYWVFDDAGFAVRGGDGGTPPPFIPGNAAFLYAVAYMAAGWQGSDGDAPGFPKDGTWTVKYEGLLKAL